MAQTAKSWQDAFTQSFGQEHEALSTVSADKNGLVVGGIYGTVGAGTLSDGDFSRLQMDAAGNLMVNIASGESINIGTMTVGTVDMLKAGTITTLSSLTAGSIAVIAGTGVVTSGSIAVTAGTITTGSIAVTAGTGIISSGSIAVTAATISAGTMQLSGTPNVGTIAMINAGTITSIGAVNVATVAAGTIAVSAGTGIITAGTVKNDGRPARNVLTYGTTLGGTAAVYGTLVGSAGAGTSIWINDISLINSKGGTITCMVGFGTALNGTSVLLKGDFGPREGAVKTYPLAVNAGMTNNDLVAYIGAAGTIDVNVSYFVSA